MVVKELRQGLRARRFIGPFLLIQLLAVFAVLSETAVADLSAGGGRSGAGPLNGGFSDGLLVFVISLVVGVVMPLTGFGALRPELERGRNVELLLLANVSRWQIVVGKWLVMCALAWLILISLVPYMLARHFIGGVNIVYSLTFLAGLAMGNAALNGVIIGASGFGNYIGRIVVLVIGGISYSVTASMCSAMWIARGALRGRGAPDDSIGTMLISTAFSFVPSVLYSLYGLQIGRSRLRLFEDPTEPPASGLIIAMMLFTPLLVGMFAVPTAGIGGVVAAAVLVFLTLVIDRGPGKKHTVRYAQP